MIVTMLTLEMGILMCISAPNDIIPARLKSILCAAYMVIHFIASVREMRLNDRISRLEDEAKKRNQTEKGGEAE